MKLNYLLFKLWVIFICIYSTINGNILKISSNEWIFDTVLNQVKTKGNVTLSINEANIYGEEITLLLDENLIISTKNVMIERNNEMFNSSSLLIDLDTQELSLSNIQIGIIPPGKKDKIYIKVKKLKDTKTKKLGKYAIFSTCGYRDPDYNTYAPHYELYAWKFHYIPNKRIQLFGAILKNNLSFFPFNIIPFPVPILELIPIPYYNYQLGKRKIIYNFPTIGKKTKSGWGWFVQNKIDYKYKNNKESQVLIDWYEAKTDTSFKRSGELGYGIKHHYGDNKNGGFIYVYNYNYKEGTHSQVTNSTVYKNKHNLSYEINQHFTYKKFYLNSFYKRSDVDERINSSGSIDIESTKIDLTYSKEFLPFTFNYAQSKNYLSNFNKIDYKIKKIQLNQSTTFTFNNKNYTSTQRNIIDSTLTNEKTLPYGIKLNNNLTFFQEELQNNSNPDQSLKAQSKITKTLPNDINMVINIDVFRDLDQELVTTDITGRNNYLYKLPEIKFQKNKLFFNKLAHKSFQSKSNITLGNYREQRYKTDNPTYSFPVEKSKFEPNVYVLDQKFTYTQKSKNNLATINNSLHIEAGYLQYVFKNKNISLFEGDAQYKIEYSINFTTKFKSFLKMNTSYKRSYDNENNNSPFYAFQKSLSKQNQLNETITLFYKKKETIKRPYIFEIEWNNSTGYNWLKKSNPYSDYSFILKIKYENNYSISNKNWIKPNKKTTYYEKKYNFYMSFKKNINIPYYYKDENNNKIYNNVYTPLLIKLDIKNKKTPNKEIHTTNENSNTNLFLNISRNYIDPILPTALNYQISFDLNELTFSYYENWFVNFSTISFEYPLGKNEDFSWNFKGTLNYDTKSNTSYSINQYELQTLSILKKEHVRTLEFGYKRNIKEYYFKFSFNMFPDDPLIYRKNNNGSQFEGRLREGAEERFL